MSSWGTTAAHTCEVAVAGGGPGGATVGRILAGWGVDVTVIAAHNSEKAGEVIGPEASAILDALGLTELFTRSTQTAGRCDGVVTHWPSTGLDREDHGLRGTYAWTVDRLRLNEALKQLAVANGCSWLDGNVAAGVTRGASGYALSVTSGGQTRIITAKFVVDATGRPGSLARRFGAHRVIDDRLIAAAVRLDRLGAHRDTYLRLTATPHGWWYRSDGPTCDTRVTIVADPRHAAGRRGALGLALRQVVEELRPGQNDDTVASRMHVMDASSARLDCCAADGWLAVGDAATAFDPLCGQGLAQAFGSGLAAAHAIRECAAGNPDALTAYDHAMQATYRRSRAQLDLRYAYRAQGEPSPFWRARARTGLAP